MSQTEPSARAVDGVELPPVGTYAVDAVHSSVNFSVRHLMVSKVRGHFSAFEGKIVVAEVPEESTVTASIDAASISTNDPNRDGHVRSADFLDVEHHPTITFESTGLVRKGGAKFSLPGNLTVRGVTKPVTLDAEYLGTVVHPQMGTRIGLTATTEIDREEFGVSFNAPLETGGVVVGKTVHLDLEVEAVAQS